MRLQGPEQACKPARTALPLLTRERVTQMHVTRRLVISPLTDNYSLAINTLSGAIDILERGELTVLERLKLGQAPPEGWTDGDVCRLMRERFYVFDSPDDEQDCLRQMFSLHEANRHSASPVQIAICPTMACNLRCRYCFQDETRHATGGTMTSDMLDAAFAVIPALKKLSDSESDNHAIILFGGEPLLPATMGLVERVAHSCQTHGHRLEVVTNGVHLEEFVPVLASADEVLSQLQVTVDGPPAIHDSRRCFRGGNGTFGLIESGIDRALAAGLPVTVRINIDRNNIAHVNELVDMFEAKGWTCKSNFHCYMFPVTHRTGDPPPHLLSEDQIIAHFQDLFRGEGNLLAKYAVHGIKILSVVASALDPNSIPVSMGPLFTYCEAAGLRYFALGPDGLIYPCGQAIGDPLAVIGQYHPVLELDEDRCRAWANRTVFAIEECRDCDIATLCGGGCAHMALRDHGRLDAPACGNARETLFNYLAAKRPFLARGLDGVGEGA